MKKIFPTAILLLNLILFSHCSEHNKLEEKGFAVQNTSESYNDEAPAYRAAGLAMADTVPFITQPRNVLLTANTAHRLVPVYKVNYDRRRQPFTGENAFHGNTWDIADIPANNQWNDHFIPGFEAMSGYNLVNVSHFNHQLKTENRFFEQAVLIKTLYYPAFSKDTLNGKPLQRNFYMISAYDEDTNKDGFINTKDLRRLYYFDINAQNPTPLIPKNCSVMSSEYDPANDMMYVFAKTDKNNNGKMEYEEATQIFWVDLSNPANTGLQYK